MLKIDRHPIYGFVITSSPANVHARARDVAEVGMAVRHYFGDRPCSRRCPICRQMAERAKKDRS